MQQLKATSGSLFLSMEYAGGFLGGDNYFIRPEATFSIFQLINDSPISSVAMGNPPGSEREKELGPPRSLSSEPRISLLGHFPS